MDRDSRRTNEKKKQKGFLCIKIMYIYAISEEIIATDYANTSDNKC